MNDKPVLVPENKIKEKMELEQKRDYFAVKSNTIIQKQRFKLAKNNDGSLTLTEQKILLYIISRIKPDDEELKEQVFDIKEFYNIAGIQAEIGNNYVNLKNAISKLASRVMWLIDGDIETTVRWIEKAKINKRSGKILIRLDEDLKPYLIMLSQNYTKIPLHDIIRMKSKYGIMLYELLRSYSFTGMKVVFSIQDLKERLDCIDYTNFTNFRKRVIEPALKDINKYSELFVDVEYHKTGRTFTEAEFTIKDLTNSKRLEDREEVIRRYSNVDKEIDPNQITIFETLYGQDDSE